MDCVQHVPLAHGRTFVPRCQRALPAAASCCFFVLLRLPLPLPCASLPTTLETNRHCDGMSTTPIVLHRSARAISPHEFLDALRATCVPRFPQARGRTHRPIGKLFCACVSACRSAAAPWALPLPSPSGRRLTGPLCSPRRQRRRRLHGPGLPVLQDQADGPLV